MKFLELAPLENWRLKPMSRLKFTSLEVDKNVSQLTSNVKKRGLRTRVVEGLVDTKNMGPGEFIFTTIKRAQEGPHGPSDDEARIYFKNNEGKTFVFTGTKVG